MVKLSLDLKTERDRERKTGDEYGVKQIVSEKSPLGITSLVGLVQRDTLMGTMSSRQRIPCNDHR